MNPQTTQNTFLNSLKRAKERAQQGQYPRLEAAFDSMIAKEQEDDSNSAPSLCTLR